MIKRRALLAAGAFAAPANAQTPQRASRARLGILMPYDEQDAVILRRVGGFREALARLGWQAGRNLMVEARWPGDNLAAVRAAAAELAQREVDIIFTTGARVVPIVQREAPRTPIVFVGVSDPVGLGLVESMARPGGNTTGFSHLEVRDGYTPLVAKQVDLMQELAPGLSRLALMFNPANPASAFHRRSFAAATAGRQVNPVLAPVRTGADIDLAVSGFADGPPGGMILPSDLTLLGLREPVVASLARHRVPALFSDESFIEIGGLASYAADRADLFSRAAGYVDRILRGERPADLPVQLPTAFLLWLNLATARALDLEISAAMLARADSMIE